MSFIHTLIASVHIFHVAFYFRMTIIQLSYVPFSCNFLAELCVIFIHFVWRRRSGRLMVTAAMKYQGAAAGIASFQRILCIS